MTRTIFNLSNSTLFALDPLLLDQESKILRVLDFRGEQDKTTVIFRRPDLTVRMVPGKAGQFEYFEIELELNRIYSDKKEVPLTHEIKLVFDLIRVAR